MDDEHIQRVVDDIKREVGTSPSDFFATVSSYTLREAVRIIDTLRAERKEA